eukprot:1694593-Karenia_brevis.AAC.1
MMMMMMMMTMMMMTTMVMMMMMMMMMLLVMMMIVRLPQDAPASHLAHFCVIIISHINSSPKVLPEPPVGE